MNDEQLLTRIVLNPKIMVGKPIIQGTRLTVDFILNLLAQEATEAEILSEYEGLAYEDIQACLLFATSAGLCRVDSIIPHCRGFLNKLSLRIFLI